ncbi:fatty acid desaturase 6 isoform X1 [Festucalex cinctus]
MDGGKRGTATTSRQGNNEKVKKDEEEVSMKELTRKVEEVVKASSWWERRGLDCTILAGAFLICLPAGFLLMRCADWLRFTCGLLLMGVAHAVITVKGSHLASHGALSHSPAAKRFWALFFIEICGAFSSHVASSAHVALHHAHTNVLGLGDSSTWKLPHLPRLLYLFVAPLAMPVITPLVALAEVGGASAALALRTLLLILLGVASHLWLLMSVSGFRSATGAALCMLATRAMFSLPFVHVNIFQSRDTAGASAADVSRRPQPAAQRPAGLDLRTLAHQLPRGAPPLPLSLRQHVSQGETAGASLPVGSPPPVPGGWLRFPPSSFLPQVSGTDGRRPAHHPAGWRPVMTSGQIVT